MDYGFILPLLFLYWGLLQHRPFALDDLLPLPAIGLKDFVEGEALHTSCRTVKLVALVVLPDATDQPLEVFTLREGEEHRVVRPLTKTLNDLHITVSIQCSPKHDLLEEIG